MRRLINGSSAGALCGALRFGAAAGVVMAVSDTAFFLPRDFFTTLAFGFVDIGDLLTVHAFNIVNTNKSSGRTSVPRYLRNQMLCPLANMPPYDFDDNARDYTAWRPYLIVSAGQCGLRIRKRMPQISAVLFGLFALYCLISYCRGDTEVDRAVIENSAFVHSSPYSASRYRWQHGVVDGSVVQSVVDARANITHSELLAVVSQTIDGDLSSQLLPCSKVVLGKGEAAENYIKLVNEADAYLRSNNRSAPNCVCAPMLGLMVRYMAVATRRVDDETDLHIQHMINPIDVNSDNYDDLDVEFFEKNGVDLSIENENQDYRYNKPRGTYRLLRRNKVRVALFDSYCSSTKITLSGTLALCSQQCLDLMRGIDVRERAEMQRKKGVTLNNPEEPSTPSPTTKQNWRDDL